MKKRTAGKKTTAKKYSPPEITEVKLFAEQTVLGTNCKLLHRTDPGSYGGTCSWASHYKCYWWGT